MSNILSSFGIVISSLISLDLFVYFLGAAIFVFAVGVAYKAIDGRG